MIPTLYLVVLLVSVCAMAWYYRSAKKRREWDNFSEDVQRALKRINAKRHGHRA